MFVFVIFTFATTAMAQSYKAGQGFQYQTPKKEQEETKNKGPQVKVLRFYNQNSKVTDPLSEVTEEAEGEQVHFFKVTDPTLGEKKERDISSLSDVSITDYEVLESVIRDLEHEMGIRSMPVVRFHKDNVQVDGLIQRLRYMEHKLGILKEVEDQNLVITDRIQNLKDKIEARYK
ncbi:MAG: hypothetical protein M9899_09350 [Bdellovibrionaceae bacterium]|nr:hypothetical protein [Pseudobdellovibrionaceae bacterium]